MIRQPIKVLICDDLEGMRTVLEMMVSRCEGFEVCATAGDGAQCLALFAQLRPQVVFLDVEMPEPNGLDCAKVIQEIDPRTFILFATAYDRFMDKAFELYAFDYLLKPFKGERVSQTLARIRSIVAEREQAQDSLRTSVKPALGREKLMLKGKESVVFVDMDEILLIQRENRQTMIYTADGVYATGEPLSAIEARLDPKQFFRTHKSYIVNLHNMDTVAPYGRWTYTVKIKGLKIDALLTAERFEQLKALFG